MGWRVTMLVATGRCLPLIRLFQPACFSGEPLRPPSACGAPKEIVL
jgi:hypothetical protein